MPPLPPTYGETHGLALMEGLEEAGKLVFTTAEAHAIGGRQGMTPAQVSLLASRLARAGWIRRIKRGLYATTGRLPGSAAPHDFTVALALAMPSALSHRTALHFHGLSDQVPRTITCTTTAKVVTPSMCGRERGAAVWEIDGLRVQMVTVRPERFFGIEDVWADQRTKVAITDRERTVLDLVADPAHMGGMGEALAILEAHHASLDLSKLVSYALRLDVAAVAKRLGWALESFGVKERVLAPLLAVPVKMIQPLDSRRERIGPVVARWQLQDNLTSPRRSACRRRRSLPEHHRPRDDDEGPPRPVPREDRGIPDLPPSFAASGWESPSTRARPSSRPPCPGSRSGGGGTGSSRSGPGS